MRTERDEQLRKADERDPDVRTDKEGYRVDEDGNRLDEMGNRVDESGSHVRHGDNP